MPVNAMLFFNRKVDDDSRLAPFIGRIFLDGVEWEVEVWQSKMGRNGLPFLPVRLSARVGRGQQELNLSDGPAAGAGAACAGASGRQETVVTAGQAGAEICPRVGGVDESTVEWAKRG